MGDFDEAALDLWKVSKALALIYFLDISLEMFSIYPDRISSTFNQF